MMIARALLLLLLLSQAGLAEEARTNKVVAIFPFHFASTDLAEKEVIQELNGLFYDLFAGQLVSTDYFEVVDRQHIAEMMEEVKLQLSGLTAEEVVQLGKAKGAELAIFGTVTKVGKQTFLTMKIIDIETTVIIKAIKQKGSLKKPDELALDAGYKFMKSLSRIMYERYKISSVPLKASSKKGLKDFLKGRDLMQQAIMAYENEDQKKMKKLRKEGKKRLEKAAKDRSLAPVVEYYLEEIGFILE